MKCRKWTLLVMLILLLTLEFHPCINEILLSIHIPWIQQKGLHESIHSPLPILKSNSHITKIIIIICRCRAHSHNILYPLKRSLGILHVTLAIICIRQIIICCNRKRILLKSLHVVNYSP